MNIQDAAYNTAHDCPGGIPALAVRMGISANVLQNKVNPSQEHHKLTLNEAVKMQTITRDKRILHAMAESLGCVCIETSHYISAADMELLDGFINVVKELGDLSGEFQKAWADGSITPRELDRIKTEAYDVHQRLYEVVSRIESLVQPES